MQGELHGTIGILGFGVDGRGVAEFLEGIDDVDRVVVFDDAMNNEQLTLLRQGSAGQVMNNNGRLFLGENLDGVDLLFRSPGFPLNHDLVKQAKEKNIPITSSTAQVLEKFEGITVGVTGSNGKTTCVALIEEFLKAEFGEDQVERGGNDGVPRLDLIRPSPSPSPKYLVLELSSFQLIDCPASPNVAVVLNISPNHLDWHADMDEYVEAKRQIISRQSGTGVSPVRSNGRPARSQGDIAILNPNDEIVKSFANGLKSEVRWFEDNVPKEVKCITHPDTIKAAVTTACTLNVSEANIEKVLREFPGVPHRLEFIRELDGVKFYNDSSCTTPESAITACKAFPKGSLVLLLGGRDKGMDFSRLYEVIKEQDVAVVPYGEMAEVFKKNITTHYSLLTTHSFEEAINTARSTGRKNVALSPACASFDMFKNAKERGKRFAEIVKSFK